jgi:hypothetical protein
MSVVPPRVVPTKEIFTPYKESPVTASVIVPAISPPFWSIVRPCRTCWDFAESVASAVTAVMLRPSTRLESSFRGSDCETTDATLGVSDRVAGTRRRPGDVETSSESFPMSGAAAGVWDSAPALRICGVATALARGSGDRMSHQEATPPAMTRTTAAARTQLWENIAPNRLPLAL